MAKKYENIENIGKLITGGAVGDLTKKISSAEKSASDILKKLNDLQAAIKQKKLEEEQLALNEAAEEEAAAKRAEEMKAQAEKSQAELKAQEERVEAERKAREEQAEQERAEAEKLKAARARAERIERAAAEAIARDEARSKGKEYRPNDRMSKPGQSGKPGQYNGAARPSYQSGQGSLRPPKGDNKTFINRDSRPPKAGAAGGTFANKGGQKTPSARFGAANIPAPQPPVKSKNFGADKKKQNFEKTYIEKDKHALSKRALVKQQGASIEDFDENKSGYRKLRIKKDKQKTTQTIKIEHAVVTTDDIPIKSLSEKIGITAGVIVNRLFKEGIMTNVNGSIDYDTAAFIAADFGVELEYKPEKTAEDVLFEQQADTVEEIEKLVPAHP